LQDRFRVIRLDLPGAGLSPPDPTGDYTDARTMALLIALQDRLGIERASLVGNSIGGRIAWTYAATHPERVDRVVLISPDGFASPGFDYGQPPEVPGVLGLMQVALPAWIVGYGVALARISGRAPARFRTDPGIAIGLGWAGVFLGAVLTTGIFVQHQRRLADLDQRRQEVLRLTPGGGFVMYEGVVSKLMGIYREDQPAYQFHMVTFMGMYCYTPHEIRAAIASGQPAYLIFSAKNAGEEPTKFFRELVEKLDGEPVPTESALVQAWKPRRNLPEDP
jgi:pimeloyl-ACP methyl ester carboxylesterase